MKHTAFDTYHPVVAAVYLTAALVFAMAAFQPVFVVLSLVVAFAYNIFLRGWRAALKTMAWQVPLLLVITVLNGIFTASGSTVLFQIGHRAFYLESVAYGFFMGLMLLAVMQWFSNLSCILTSDKIMQLTGSTMPTIGLMMTMILRLVPQFLRRGNSIRLTQEACTSARTAMSSDGVSDSAPVNACDELGSKQSKMGFFERKAHSARGYLRDISVLMGWGMEDSLDTAEAMRARGWAAVRKRSTYKRSEFRARDGVVLAIMGAFIAASAFLAVVACSQFTFYPQMSRLVLWWGYIPYVLFLLTPFVLELKECITWIR